MIALAIEECNLHRRVALCALRLVGTSPRMLLVGFMLPTAVMSMWISNTAAAAMMIPILEALLTEVIGGEGDEEQGKTRGKQKNDVSPKTMRAMLAMSVCMSANIGGTATTIGKENSNFSKLQKTVGTPKAAIRRQLLKPIWNRI